MIGIRNPRFIDRESGIHGVGRFSIPFVGHYKDFLISLSNRPLPNSKNTHFQNEAQPLISCENELYLREIEKSFPYQRLST